MKNFIEQRKYELTCISPVHVGSGTALQPFEYLFDNKNKCVYIMDREKWIQLLCQYNLMEALSDFLEIKFEKIRKKSDAQTISVMEWLRRNGVKDADIVNAAQRKMKMADIKAKNSLNIINLAVCEADGRLYIPGSSIKGVMRTAILYKMLSKDPAILRQYAQEMLYVVKKYQLGRITDRRQKDKMAKDKKSALGNIAQKLENELLRKLRLDTKNGTRSAINDVMRGIAVSDARAEEIQSLIVEKIDVSTYTKVGKKPGVPLFRECAAPESKFHFTVRIDKDIMKVAGIKSVDEIFVAAKEYMLHGLSMQKRVFGKNYGEQFAEAENANFFLGGGTGFLQKSLWFSLFSDEKTGMEELKKYLDENFSMHRHLTLDKQISPRTLKLAKTGGVTQLMGLCRIDEI